MRLTVDFSEQTGKIKPMHAVNNGPVVAKSDQTRGNDKYWPDSGIPYVRNHDAGFCYEYGGAHIVDVHQIFPDFNADVNDPASYDFILTDEYTRSILQGGSKVFYRLGSKIEHEVKKYGTIPPPDFQKWAEICAHIILHYNEGWADGFHWNIEYWEIWNEPDLDAEDAPNKRNWGGTDAEFYRLFRTAALYLKKRFPHLKIGGPALAYNYGEWLDGFFKVMTGGGERVPLDFFSWHKYAYKVEQITEMADAVRKKLDDAGYTETESILNEWNYIKSWTDGFVSTVETIISIKGAAFQAACMLAAQCSDNIDMLMYYDARPSAFNGLFDYYTQRPLKGYYSIKMFNELYRLGNACGSRSDDGDVYAAAACGENGGQAVMIAYYTDEDDAQDKRVGLRLVNGKNAFSVYLLDGERDAQPVGVVPSDGELVMRPNTVVLLKA